jgi:trigger factor
LPSEDICRGELEISVPWEEVEEESKRILTAYRKQAKIPGFRPGKAPETVIRTRFAQEIRQDLLERIVPKHFWKEAKEQDFHVIGSPNISEVQFEENEPLKFKAEFEIVPDFELGKYARLQIPFKEPQVTEDEIDEEIERLRERHASYKNLDPRPLEDGDVAVVALSSEETEDTPKIEQSETTITIGGEETLADFSAALRGKTPGEEADFEVTYPEDFGNEKLAGKKIRFHAEIKSIRVKELPELDDDFAAEAGDFRTLDELKGRIREELQAHKRNRAISDSKELILDQLIEAHDFPAPPALVDQALRSRLERMMRTFASQGVDVENAGIDWRKMAEEQRPRAVRDVKASLLLERIAEAEAIEVPAEELDAEVERFAQRNQTTLSRARQQLAESGALDQIEQQMRNEKTLSYLFDECEKIDAPGEAADAAEAAEPEDGQPAEKDS